MFKTKTMSKDSTKKITEAELKTIQGVTTRKNELNERMVRLAWLEIDLKLGKEKNEAEAIELSKLEAEFADSLENTYGKIVNLNIETGEYTTEQ